MARPRARTCMHLPLLLACCPQCVTRARHDRGASEIGEEMTSTQETSKTSLQYKVISAIAVAMFCFALGVISASAQTTGYSSLSGVVADPSGAVVPGATVEIHNPVSQFDRSTTTDSAGRFSFPNIPFNPYHLSVKVAGFAAYSQDVDVCSAVRSE